MKTPKRFSSNPRAVDLYAQRFSRWKRKNRIKQLKNTITRQHKEIEWLKENLRCIKCIVNGAQNEKGIDIFVPTLEEYEP